MTKKERARKRIGCLKAILVLLVLFGIIKGCSAYQNRPTALYERWLGGPVPEDVTNLNGAYKFQLTESIAILTFEAPPERIAQIVSARGMTLVIPDTPWHLSSDSRKITIDNQTHSELWFRRKKPYPPGQKIYWVAANPRSDFLSGGWALYYDPTTKKAFFTLHTI